MDYLGYGMTELELKFLLGGAYMTKTKYENEKRKLEEKEGKLYSIPEVSDMLKISQESIHSYLRDVKASVIKIRHWKTQRNITLVPEKEVLSIIALQTPCLSILRALKSTSNMKNATISEVIEQLDSLKGET